MAFRPGFPPSKAVVDELKCPITCDLPVISVTAEDGYVYEKEAIEEYFEGTSGHQVKSPMTREMMGRQLLPALQHRNTIEILILTGVINGDPADKWYERKGREELLKDARKGDIEAMGKVASNYHFGLSGFEKNNDEAYSWCKRAQAAGSATGMAILGVILATGDGEPEQGVMYLALAAGRGSNYAAYVLGSALINKDFGLHSDVDAARRLLQQSIDQSCAIDHMPDTMKADARSLLSKLVEINDSGNDVENSPDTILHCEYFDKFSDDVDDHSLDFHTTGA